MSGLGRYAAPQMRRILALTAVAAMLAVLVASAEAYAQGGAFGPLPQANTTPTTTTVSATTTGSQGGLKTWQEILLFIGGVALIGGISYGILSDAKRAAPVTAEEGAGHAMTAAGARKAQSKDQARKRAKAARAARKRNR